MKCFLFSLLSVMCLVTVGQGQATHTHSDGTTHAAHEEESQPKGIRSEKDHFTVYGESDKYELTLYYPELTAGQESHLMLFIADVYSNRPVENAKLSLSARSGDRAAQFEAEPREPGIYAVHANFPENRGYTINVQIDHLNGPDLVGLEGIIVGQKLWNEAEETLPHSHWGSWLLFVIGLLLGSALMFFILRSRSRALTMLALLTSAWFSNLDGSFVWAHGDDGHSSASGMSFGKGVESPKETQFLFEVFTQPVAIDDYRSSTALFGVIIPASDGIGVVTAPRGGRITSVKAAVGQFVRAGQVLAVLQQTVSAADAVGVAATNAALTLQLENAKIRASAAQQAFNRLKSIEDIASGRELTAAEADWSAARAELSALEGQIAKANSAANIRNISLVAPISGVVGAFALAPGAEVIEGQVLLTVTNISKVYIEAQVYDRDLPMVQAGNKFIATCSTDDHKTAEVRLLAQAQIMNPGNQSQRVLFELENPDGEFKIGEFITLKAYNAQGNRQIAIPNSALTDVNGKTAVFIKKAPEEFELSYVQIGEDDGMRTTILKGLEEGEKVVINGAYEIKMMYLNQ